MRVLLTGASGFIGSHLAERLVDLGYDVTCMVRKTSNVEFLKTLNVRLVYGSLEDRDSLRRVVTNVDLIYHPAGLIKARCRPDFFTVNCEGTRNLLNAIIEASSGLQRFVYFSSQAAVGPAPDPTPLTESAPLKPITNYGKSKAEGERIIRELAHKHDIPFTIIRPPAVFGPRDMEILFFYKEARRGSLTVIGNPDKRLSIVYVRDLVDGTILAAESDRGVNETFFIAYDKPITWQWIATHIGEVLGRECRLRVIPYPVAYMVAFISELYSSLNGRVSMINRDKIRELAQRYWVCSPAKIREHLHFAPGSSIEYAMATTAEWYKKKGYI